MKTRIVMWGSNEKDEKVLIAIALKAEDNAVEIFTFPFDTTTEEFYNLMLNEWRESHEVPFPQGFSHIVRPLTASDSILPDTLKVDRSDIINRAQTEWHFVVLSNKLYQSFLHELKDIKGKLSNADQYKNQLWEDMKETWEKVQKHIFDKTLLREHGQQLREMTNDIFTQLKDLRKNQDAESDKASREVADSFNARLDQVEEKIKSGLGLQPLFNDLKKMQIEFKDAQLSRGDRAKIWKRIDHAFKAVKEKKFGEKSTRDTSALDRLNRRLEGLLSAIDKMEKSIKRDDKDRLFQDDRIAHTEGQLEAQIRMAKLKMIDERVNSKNEKLAEMLKTKAELEDRIQREKKFLEEQKKHQALKDELKEAKESVKQKIAETIHASADHVDTEALEKAAQAIAEQKEKKKKQKSGESLLGAITETIGDSMTDLGDTLGAVASVVGDKIEEKFKDLKEDAKDKAADADTFFDKVKDEVKEKAADIKEGAGHLAEDAKVKAAHLKAEAKDMAHDLKEKAEHIKEGLEDKLDKAEDKVEAWSDEAKEKLAHLKDEAKEQFEHLKEAVGDIPANVSEKVEELAQDLKEKLSSLTDSFKKDEEEPGKEEEGKA